MNKSFIGHLMESIIDLETKMRKFHFVMGSIFIGLLLLFVTAVVSQKLFYQNVSNWDWKILLILLSGYSILGGWSLFYLFKKLTQDK